MAMPFDDCGKKMPPHGVKNSLVLSCPN